jgi:Flp pilus assembly protein TadB
VHWEIGGSLAPTLATVGRTIRDRIDLSRRIRSQTMQARASVVAILLITYAITFIVWRTNPGRLQAFLATTLGGALVFATVVLQLLGLVWMSKLSKIEY